MPIGLGQKQHDRRRRVLRDERVGEETANEGTRRRGRRRPPHRYGAGARRQRQPALLDLLPRRWPALSATCVAAFSMVLTLLLGVWGATASGPLANWQVWQSSNVGSMLSRAVSWCGSVTMLGVALVAFQVFLLRKHRRDDYQGHYTVWLWAAVFSLVTASDLSIGWGAWAIESLAASMGLPFWAVTFWMMVPTLGIAVRLGFEVRESRVSLLLLVATTLLAVSGVVATRALSDPVWLARVSASTILVGASGALVLSLWHLRFVVAQVHSHGVVQGEEPLEDHGDQMPESRSGSAKVTADAAAAPRPASIAPAKTPAPLVSAAGASGVSSSPVTVAQEPIAPAATSGLGDRIASISQGDDAGDEEGDEDLEEGARRGGMSKAQRRKLAKQERRRQRDAA